LPLQIAGTGTGPRAKLSCHKRSINNVFINTIHVFEV
jgi:hypothetical protein